MRNLRCWLFGHEWVVTKAKTYEFVDDWTAEEAACIRCPAWVAFCDGDCDHEECDCNA